MAELTKEARCDIQELSDKLVEAWDTQERFADEDGAQDAQDYWVDTKEGLLSQKNFAWVSDEGARIVCGLSRTLDGRFVTDDRTPIVVKFEPWISDGSLDKDRYDNHHEIDVWRQAVDLGDDDLFATIIEYEDDGRWLAMEECIPIRRQRQGANEEPSEYLYDKNGKAIGGFKKLLDERNWYEHDLKHGNVGVHPETGEIHLLDYGSFTEYQG